jgi:hypothetical protein
MQCRERWVRSLDTANGKKRKPRLNWEPEEDAKLTEAVKKHGEDCWVAVAAMVPDRTNVQCHHRWTQTLDPVNGNKATKWTPELDAKLTKAVKKHGKDWVAVAKLVPGRTNQRCRKRWVQTLDPGNTKKGAWTPEEDAKLMEGKETWQKVGRSC